MSVRKLKLRLSLPADLDLYNIRLYTERTWGEERASSYKAAITRALRRLQTFPELGQVRNEIFLGCRSVQVEQHIVYYHRPQETEIVVARILHARQNASDLVDKPIV